MAQFETRAWNGIRTRWEEKEYHRHFVTCLGRAEELIEEKVQIFKKISTFFNFIQTFFKHIFKKKL